MNTRHATPSPKPEMWSAKDIAEHLKCDKMKAEEIIKIIRAEHNVLGYGDVRKEWVMDYIREKERIERERDARYQSDLANVESIAVLKEQVATLKDQVKLLQQGLTLAKEEAASSAIRAKSSKALSIIAMIVSALAALAAAVLPFLIRHWCGM